MRILIATVWAAVLAFIIGLSVYTWHEQHPRPSAVPVCEVR